MQLLPAQHVQWCRRPLHGFRTAPQRMRSVQATPGAAPAVVTEPSEAVLRTWREADSTWAHCKHCNAKPVPVQAVCFDVDSTLCIDESIDELAQYLGVGAEVAEMTRNAMGGTTRFEDALAARLAIMAPSRKAVDAFVASHPPQYSPGIPELVARLQQQRKAVFLVSGGFHAIIDPIAQHLGIPAERVYANVILYKDGAAGSYAGFDAEQLTARSGGKLRVAEQLKAQHGYKRLVAIGDGATDLEARHPGGADIFIGYGGSVYRPSVAQAADWYVTSIQPLLDALQ